MAFDGLFINTLVQEIKRQCLGARVDKIHQPEGDELTIQLRGLKETLTLFISVESSMPYFTLTQNKKENPQSPPMFCMLMRKHLTGGRLLDITQTGFERVITFKIEARNELSELEIKYLIVEIMGKHSNVILTREDLTIIDSIKRITPDMSRVRTLLPGLKFEYLESEKHNFINTPASVLLSAEPETQVYKALYQTFEGFSPETSDYLLRKAQLPQDMVFASMESNDFNKLEFALSTLKSKLQKNAFEGYIFKNSKDKKIFTFLDDFMPTSPEQITPSLSQVLDTFYGQVNHTLKMHQKSLNLKKTLQTRIDRLELKIKKMTLELKDAQNAEDYKIKGELLLTHLHAFSKGDSQVEVTNYYCDPPTQEWIHLDNRLEPSANAQQYFKKYNKLKTASETLLTLIKEAQNDLHYLEQTLTLLDTSDDSATVEEIRTELALQGIIKKRTVKKGKSKPSTDYRKFKSTDGFEILVGKNNHQNDTLTLKLASNKDLWLHTKDIPGSHVIIRTYGEEPPMTTIEEAAVIAAYFSKARLSSNVPVDYTLVKNVSKPSGAKPGMVIYVKNKTTFVTPSYDFITKHSYD